MSKKRKSVLRRHNKRQQYRHGPKKAEGPRNKKETAKEIRRWMRDGRWGESIASLLGWKIDIVAGRECGDCHACCVQPDIQPLGKPAGVRCPKLTDGGKCRVYSHRPPVCRGFFCGWLAGFGEEEDKPDKSGLIVLQCEPVHMDVPDNNFWNQTANVPAGTVDNPLPSVEKAIGWYTDRGLAITTVDSTKPHGNRRLHSSGGEEYVQRLVRETSDYLDAIGIERTWTLKPAGGDDGEDEGAE